MFYLHFIQNFTRNFLRGSANRRTPPPSIITSTSTKTTSSVKFSRPTTASRRKYLTRTTTAKPLESQETTINTTTTKPKFIRHEFASRRPPFLRRTTKPLTTSTSNAIDEKQQTTKPLLSETEDSIGKPLEIRDVVLALQNIQNAPLPTTRIVPETTESVSDVTTEKLYAFQNVIQPNISDIYFTTSKPKTRLRLTGFTTTKLVNTAEATTTLKSIKTPVTRTPVAHTFAYTSPYASESLQHNFVNRISSLPALSSYSNINILNQIPEHSKVLLHSNGVIECLDQGNFPHPISCKRFISCAKEGNGKMIGWEYTCPKNLSFDPIGGICNWSGDLGCDEK